MSYKHNLKINAEKGNEKKNMFLCNFVYIDCT